MDPGTGSRRHRQLTSGQDTWSARCGESRTAGAEGGLRETTGGNTGTAPAGLPYGAAWSLHTAGDPAAEDWVAVKALAVLAGDSARAATEISAETDAAGLTGTHRTGTDACVRYLTSKDEYLRYDQALTAGWPIATGVIEGACRHLIGNRLDITGARWGLQGAEAILTLRAVIANGDYWRYHLAREHQRLYPGTAQGQHTLSA
jgi:hypothetical protein